MFTMKQASDAEDNEAHYKSFSYVEAKSNCQIIRFMRTYIFSHAKATSIVLYKPSCCLVTVIFW